MEQKKVQKSKDLSEELISQMISNLIGYSQQTGNLLEKYDEQFYLSYFDRLKIDEVSQKFPQNEIQMQEFIRIFINLINHQPDETIYLSMSLIELYRKIKEESNNDKGIKFSDFTSFLCQKISEGDPDLVVPMKEIPMEKMLPDISRIRDIDLHPPSILSKVQLQRPKITKNKNKKDKKLDEKKPVAKFIFSRTLNAVIALGRLSSSISLYDPQELKVKNKITPSACKLMSKDVAILSIAFCERNQRIGCIINNIGITFWEASDNFSTEKILGVNKSDYDPTLCGDKIYYLNLFNEWITTDKNTIYFWDLKEEVITNSIIKSNATSINDICEITHLRSILVSYTLCKSEEKCLVLYHDNKQISRIILGNPGCHSICYNVCTQLIICLGYQSSITVYEIDYQTYDIHVVRQLKGHTSILTCISNIPDSPMILTGDDLGNVKVWELNYMRCIQSIKIAKTLIQIQCNGKQLMFADSRLNSILMDNPSKMKIVPEYSQVKERQLQENYAIYEFTRKDTESIWIITQKNAREINMKTGKTKNIFMICNPEDDISTAAELINGFLIGTSKGQLLKYSFSGDLKWKISAHEGEVHCVRSDPENKLIATLGNDNNFIIWSEKHIMLEDNIRKKIVFSQKDIKFFEMCPYRNLFFIGSTDCKLSIWDYQTLKLHYIVKFSTLISAIRIMADRPSVIICTIDGLIHLYAFERDGPKTRFYKKQTVNLRLNLIQEDLDESKDLQKSEIQIKMENSVQSLYVSTITSWQVQSLLFITTNQGNIHCFHMTDYEPNPQYKKQYNPSTNLKRPIRSTFQNQVLKNQHVYLDESETIYEEGVLTELWRKKIHKQNIVSTSILSMNEKYLCTLCNDGYFKVTKVNKQEGETVGSLKINHPLPIKWNIEISKMYDLRANLHETILILDSILKNSFYDLSLKEQRIFDISNFLQKMISENYTIEKFHQNIRLMSQEYTTDDIQKVPFKQTSLKTLQAYKRLQYIKRQNKPDLSFSSSSDFSHYETPFLQKQVIRNYLSPNYLPKLLNKGIVEESNPAVEGAVNRLMENLGKQKHQYKLKNKENTKNFNTFSAMKTMIKKIIKKDDNEKTLSPSYVEKKTVRKIMDEINKKLNEYKKKPNSTSATST